ncbi:MAG: hypothetical protein [Caudoviricetes sp.]|nr:MAG: hypothetical protein [Caudoviricetes sp.]
MTLFIQNLGVSIIVIIAMYVFDSILYGFISAIIGCLLIWFFTEKI